MCFLLTLFLQNSGTNEVGIKAYQRALQTLPVENLSRSDKNIKRQCEDDLRAIQDKIGKKPEYIVANGAVVGELPWKRADKMKSELEARRPAGVHSSVSTITS